MQRKVEKGTEAREEILSEVSECIFRIKLFGDSGGKLPPNSVLWRNRRYRNLMGEVIQQDGYLYGSHCRRNRWSANDLRSGDFTHDSSELGGGVLVYADGLFYC